MTIGHNSAPAPHEAHPARRLGSLYQQFHTKSWSDLFECPCCGKRQRFNTNYLGNRRVPMCDGVKMVASERMDWAEWTALNEKAKAAAIEFGRSEGLAKNCKPALAA